MAPNYYIMEEASLTQSSVSPKNTEKNWPSPLIHLDKPKHSELNH